MQTLDRLMTYLEHSPSPFHAAASAAALLEEGGFVRLEEGDAWALKPGGQYYVTRNQSSLIAFRLPGDPLTGWRMTAAHSDSPTFRIKNDGMGGDKRYARLEVEGYGGMSCASWLDRPLTVAGRVVVRTPEGVESRLVYLDRDLLSTDIVLCPRQKPVRLGAAGELFQAPRIDDLACAYATLEGLLRAGPNPAAGQVYCLFDNEEVGSGTRQGAMSSFLPDVLARAALALGLGEEERRRALANSLLLSADNGHAVHPNFPEKADPENRVYPNGGVVVKLNASQKYTTTGLTAGLFRAVCQRAGVPVQVFANRADEPGGSTLGNLLSHAVSIPMVDIGMAQLAMHAAVETAGSQDPEHLSRACTAFFEAAFTQCADGRYVLG